MLLKRSAVIAMTMTVAMVGNGCAKKKGGAASDPATTTDNGQTPDSTKNPESVKNVDGAVVTDKTSSLVIPGSLNLFGGSNGASLTDYDDDQGRFNTDDQSLQALSSISTILCFLGSLNYADEHVVNKGAFISTFDMNTCDKSSGGGGGSGGSSGSTSKQVKMVNVAVDSKREDKKPLQVKAWFDMQESDNTSRIAVALTVAQGPSTINPIGIFRMMFLKNIVATDGSLKPVGKGFLESVRNDKGQVHLRFAETSNSKDAGGKESYDDAAGVLLRIDPDTKKVVGGTGNLSNQNSSSYSGKDVNKTAKYTLDWNNNYFAGHGVSTGGQLVDSAKDFCKDETQFNMSVWRYGVYDNATKNRLALKGGFPLKGTVNGKQIRAFASYYGLWADGNMTLPSGTQLTKETFGDPNASGGTYKTVSSPGKITKSVKKTVALKDIDGMDLQVYDQSASGNVRVVWNEASKVFQKTGTMSMSQGGGMPDWTDVTPTTYTFSRNGNTSAFSQGLGGRVDIALDANGQPSGAAIYTQSDVTSTLGDTKLYCFQNCLLANLTASMISGNKMIQTPPSSSSQQTCSNGGGGSTQSGGSTPSGGTGTSGGSGSTGGSGPSGGSGSNGGGSCGPNPFQAFPLASPVAYSFQHSTMQLLDSSGAPIAMKSGEKMPSSSMGPGANIQTLIDGDTLAKMQAAGTDPQMASQQDVTYAWSVGNPEQPWTMYQGLVDGNGTPVTFDPPVIIDYQHTAANEASGNATLKAIGKIFHIQYDGSNLQIPGHPDKDSGFWVNDFSIKAGSVSMDNKYLIKPLDGTKYMKSVDMAKCTAAGLDPSKAPDLPSISDFDPGKANTDPMPDLLSLSTLVVSGQYVGK